MRRVGKRWPVVQARPFAWVYDEVLEKVGGGEEEGRLVGPEEEEGGEVSREGVSWRARRGGRREAREVGGGEVARGRLGESTFRVRAIAQRLQERFPIFVPEAQNSDIRGPSFESVLIEGDISLHRAQDEEYTKDTALRSA